MQIYTKLHYATIITSDHLITLHYKNYTNNYYHNYNYKYNYTTLH